MKDYLSRRIASWLPKRVIYWCIVYACASFHNQIKHLKNRDEISINDLVEHWFNKTK